MRAVAAPACTGGDAAPPPAARRHPFRVTRLPFRTCLTGPRCRPCARPAGSAQRGRSGRRSTRRASFIPPCGRSLGGRGRRRLQRVQRLGPRRRHEADLDEIVRADEAVADPEAAGARDRVTLRCIRAVSAAAAVRPTRRADLRRGERRGPRSITPGHRSSSIRLMDRRRTLPIRLRGDHVGPRRPRSRRSAPAARSKLAPRRLPAGSTKRDRSVVDGQSSPLRTRMILPTAAVDE
jgi:hypothetical protein